MFKVMAPSRHVSQNSLSGSLLDTPIPRLLDACKKHMVTGWVRVSVGRQSGSIELRGGGVDEAEFGDLKGGAALERMRRLGDGDYELVQRLPSLDGSLGSAAAFEGDLGNVSLVDLMRHCEHNALTCSLQVSRGDDEGRIEYRAGEIVEVELNGDIDEDRIVDLIDMTDAHFHVSAPPLDVGIEGWPSVRKDPTAPFRIEHLTEPPVPAAGSTRQPAAPAAEARVVPSSTPLPGMADEDADESAAPVRAATAREQPRAIAKKAPRVVSAPMRAATSTPIPKVVIQPHRRVATGTDAYDAIDDTDLVHPPARRMNTESVITSARFDPAELGRPRRAGLINRLRLRLAQLVAGQPIEPSVPMLPANRKFERAAFALKRWMRR